MFRDRNRREGYDVETDLVECTACGMRYLDPVPQARDWVGQYEVGHQQNRRQRTRSGLGRYLEYAFYLWSIQIWARDMRLHFLPHGSGGGKKILDVGCGSGGKLVHFQERGFQIFGIDVSRTAIAEARGEVGGDLRVGTFESADYPTDFFDVIRFDNVLEHIYDPKSFLQKVFVLLRPGGAAYGYVPSGISPTLRWMGKYSVSSWVPFHLNLFTPEALMRLARETGFEASVLPISNPNWVALSVYQWLNRNQQRFDFADGFWLQKIIMALVAPLWWGLKRFGMCEESCLEAIRPEIFGTTCRKLSQRGG